MGGGEFFSVLKIVYEFSGAPSPRNMCHIHANTLSKLFYLCVVLISGNRSIDILQKAAFATGDVILKAEESHLP